MSDSVYDNISTTQLCVIAYIIQNTIKYVKHRA